jgi:large subunit ribosomal protein L37Ae
MGNTKKVSSTGRFGSRYGVGVKKRVLKVEEKQNAAHQCPYCGFKKIKREAAGLFNCKKCLNKFTGGAYYPETLVGKTIKKMVLQKSFAKDSVVLMKAENNDSISDIESEVKKSMDKMKPESK